MCKEGKRVCVKGQGVRGEGVCKGGVRRRV